MSYGESDADPLIKLRIRAQEECIVRSVYAVIIPIVIAVKPINVGMSAEPCILTDIILGKR